MRNSLSSAMTIRDPAVAATLRCAQCGEPVPSGVSHTCPQKEQSDEQNQKA